jgi:hypothetical protein
MCSDRASCDGVHCNAVHRGELNAPEVHYLYIYGQSYAFRFQFSDLTNTTMQGFSNLDVSLNNALANVKSVW